jgi:ubiquitin-like 1-activating enzyme E1 B
VFNADIKNLLSMADMWRSRSPPTPLDFDSIMDGSFDLNGAPSLTADAVASGSGSDHSSSSSFAKLPNGQLNGNGDIPVGEGLKDQRALTLKDNLELFVSR